MYKLFKANMSRLSKTKIFWLDLVLLAAITVVVMLNYGRSAINMQSMGYEGYTGMDEYQFNLVPVLGIFVCVVTALFLGTDYADGTIRNKLICGHTRNEIYAANLLTNFIIAFSFTAVYFLASLVGLVKLSPWQMSAGQLLSSISVCIFSLSAVAAVLTLVGMVSHNKAATAILSVFTVLGMLLIASFLYNKLQEPEMTSEMYMTLNGIEMGDPKPNPTYIGGSLRTVCECIVQLLPTGQGILLANGEYGNALLFITYSLIIIAVTTAIGMVIFRKKDLK